MKIKVQCISNKCGYHQRLERGKWYDAEEYQSGSVSYIIRGLGKKEHPLEQDYGVYDKSLFRTLDEKREHRLNKILK